MRPWLLVSLLLVAVAIGVLMAAPGDATFAASTGFSGRYGFDCTSCHAAPPQPIPEATVSLDGVPSTWEPGATYSLSIRVEGGPPAAPAPQPQGGFELDSDGGGFSVPAGMEGVVRIVGHSATYTTGGTLRRDWNVDWTAPGLEVRPTAVTIYLAGMAANGNHNIALNASDYGELGDATDTFSVTVPPAAGAMDAWRALPLAEPTVSEPTSDGSTVVLDGTHNDANATTLAWRLDDRPWERRDTGPQWRLVLPAGDHTLTLRSEGNERRSPEVTVVLDGSGHATGLERVTPWPAGLAPVGLLFMAASLRRLR